MLTSLLTTDAVGQPPLLSASAISLDGARHRPLAEAKGRPVAIVFIAHDCPICNTYAPEIGRIAKEYGKRGLVLEIVYAEPGLSLQTAKVHAKAYSYGGLSVFLDSTGAFAKACKATITPEAAVYDGAGRLAYLGRIDNRYVGFGKQRARVTSRDLRSAIEATLKHKQVAHARTQAVGCYIATNSE